MVTDLRRVLAKIDTPRFHSLHWFSTTVGRILTWIIVLTPPILPLWLVKISWTRS